MYAHPFGHCPLGVMDLRRHSGYKHPYVKAVVDRNDFTIVVLLNEEQARLSGRLRYCEADSTFGVVAPGAAKEGVTPEAVSSSAKQAFYWNHFSVVYVGLGPSGGRVQCGKFIFCLRLGLALTVPNRSFWPFFVLLLRFLPQQLNCSILEPRRHAVSSHGDWQDDSHVRDAL